jgi:hypothetical protein
MDLGPAQLVFYNGILCLALALGNGWLPSFFAARKGPAIICSIGGLALFLTGIVLTNSTFQMLLLFGLTGLVIGLGVTLLTVKISDSAPDAIQGEVMGVQLSLRVLGDAIEGIAKLAAWAKFDDFCVGSVFRKVTYPIGHRRFAKNPNPT